jgi:hypothetical protein
MLMIRPGLLVRQLDQPAVDANALASSDLIAELGDSAIDRYPPVNDPALDCSAGAETRVSKRFLDSFGQRSSPALAAERAALFRLARLGTRGTQRNDLGRLQVVVRLRLDRL